MSVATAMLLWLAVIVGLKVALIAADPKYRADHKRWLGGPVRDRLWLIRHYPIREIGWYVVSFAIFPLFIMMVSP